MCYFSQLIYWLLDDIQISMNVDPAHVFMVLVLIMWIATLVLAMMATLDNIVKQVGIFLYLVKIKS